MSVFPPIAKPYYNPFLNNSYTNASILGTIAFFGWLTEVYELNFTPMGPQILISTTDKYYSGIPERDETPYFPDLFISMWGVTEIPPNPNLYNFIALEFAGDPTVVARQMYIVWWDPYLSPGYGGVINPNTPIALLPKAHGWRGYGTIWLVVFFGFI